MNTCTRLVNVTIRFVKNCLFNTFTRHHKGVKHLLRWHPDQR